MMRASAAVVVTLMLICVGCQSKSTIIGKWEAVPEPGANPGDSATWEFRSDNRYIVVVKSLAADLNLEGEYKVSGNELRILSASLAGAIGENIRMNEEEEKIEQSEVTLIAFKQIDSNTLELTDSSNKVTRFKRIN